VVAVKEGINLPRYPTLRGRMAARRAPISRIEPVPGSSGQSKVILVTPPAAGTRVDVLGEGAETAPAIVDILEGLGLI
jgi:electron transfer flavoprotein beta subunit